LNRDLAQNQQSSNCFGSAKRGNDRFHRVLAVWVVTSLSRRLLQLDEMRHLLVAIRLAMLAQNVNLDRVSF
jgi:hypothetical protein